MIDTHAHLSDNKLAAETSEIISRALLEGVKRIIMPSTSLEDARAVMLIAEKYPETYALVGIHPEEVINNPKMEVSVEDIVETIEKGEKVIGIGEIGLDFYWDKEKKTKQEQVGLFEMQLRIAEAMKLPVVIHMREAEEEMLEVMSRLEHLPRGQFHCWSGSRRLMSWVLEKGFYVSFCGNVTYDGGLAELAKKVPFDRLLLETDSPYLAPGEMRGKRNEPKNVKITARFLAGLFDKSFEEIVDTTTKNARELFNKLN